MAAQQMRTRRHDGRTSARRWLSIPVVAIGVAILVALPGIAALVELDPGANPKPPVSDQTSVVGGHTAVVAAGTDTLNVRSGPSMSASVITSLATGTSLIVTGEGQNGFLPVDTDGASGWAFADYVQLEDQSPDQSPGSQVRPDVSGPDAQAAETTRSGEEPVAGDAASRPAPDESPPVDEPDVGVADSATGLSQGSEAGEALDITETADEPLEEPDRIPGDSGEHWIEVDRSDRLVMLHAGHEVVATYGAKLGRDPSPDGFYSTAVGTYFVFSMSDDLSDTPFAEGVYLDNWVGFDPERKNGFHSPVLDAYGNENPQQNPSTFGCVRLDAPSAEAVYSFAAIGMRVEVHE